MSAIPMKRFVFLALLLVALLAGGYWYQRSGAANTAPTGPTAQQGISAPGGRGAEARPVHVISRPVEARPVPVEITTIGSVQPLATVAVRTRLDSVVETVHFTEGQEVKAGDLLFTLDPRPAQAQLRQAEANLERDRAQLERARTDVQRYQELLRRDAVARQQYETAVAQANALEGTVKADMAAIDSARLTLGYTRITAPMAGRTGAVLVTPGNTVRPADGNPLVVLTQMRPIAVAFNIPERDLAAVRQATARGPLSVRARVPGDDAAEPLEGQLSFIDSTVDSQSGTILVKGQFDNTDTRLWPGQYVEVVLVLRIDTDALTVAAEAVQTGQDGPFVWVVRPDRTVEIRTVVMDRTVGGRAVITRGLSAGERVVIDGQSRLVPGARVEERTAGDGKTGGGQTGNGGTDGKGRSGTGGFS